MIVCLDSNSGRIGRFLWFNGVMHSFEIHGSTYNGSVHRVWREGVCGWGSCVSKPFYWRTIK
jgi:hypothetical protein